MWLCGEDKYDLDYMMGRCIKGLKVNLKKTKYIAINGGSTDLQVNGKRI